MKSFCNDDNDHNNNSNNNNCCNDGTNWLGFSLSPHMKMGVVVQDPQNHNNNNNQTQPNPSASGPSNLFNSSPHFNNYGICYGDNVGGYYSHMPIMPLKSDGSLCIMEALTRSSNPQLPQHPQQQATMATTSTPKLEDFFGGALKMGTHQYETNEREAMALSLDSMYYHHDQNNLNQNQQNPKDHQQQQIQTQHYPFNYSAIRGHEMLLLDESKNTQMGNANLQLQTDFKNWVSRTYPNGHEMQQKMIMVDNNNHINGESGSVSGMAYGDLQTLSLSMSPGSQSSCVTGSHLISQQGLNDCVAVETKKRGQEKVDQKQVVHRKSIDTFGQRTSQYRGVTRHRWTGRYEAHLWDNSCKKEGQSRRGRQVYLGGYDMEEKAARAYDQAALKYWGPSTHTNFPLDDYVKELDGMKNMTRQEYVAHLRRKSSGFSRGASMYRGVTRHHQHGRWQARIGRVAGNKDLYLGTYSTQEEAAEAYDIAAIKFRGVNAVTNFDISKYEVERIMASNILLAGDQAIKKKELVPTNETTNQNPETYLQHKINETAPDWKMVLSHPSHQFTNNYGTQSFHATGTENLASSLQQQEANRAKANAHDSNTGSSLNSSREGSPERITSFPMLFAMPPANPSSNTNSWISPAGQLRPTSISSPQMPLYAAWTDS